MHRSLAILSSLLPVILCASAACSSSSTPPSGETGDDGGDTKQDSGGPALGTMSFKNDVMPLFWTGTNKDVPGANSVVDDGSSCTATSSCHGQKNSGELNFFLGDSTQELTADVASSVRKLIVNVKAIEIPSMNFVTPGDPANSYMLFKMKNTQDTLSDKCSEATQKCSNCTQDMPCGAFMPYNGVQLPDDYVAVVEAWIAQGAKDN